jgi:hypothetical protein
LGLLSLVFALSCTTAGVNGSSSGAAEGVLWESFETDSIWAVESARGPVKISRARENATEGKTALKLAWDGATGGDVATSATIRGDFEIRREVRLDLSRMKKATLDVTVASSDVMVAMAFRATPGDMYFETSPVKLRKGLNRAVTFRLDARDFNKFENPSGMNFQGRDDVRRVSIVVFRDKTKAGEAFIDNLRFVGEAETLTGAFTPRILAVKQPDVIVRRYEMMEIEVQFEGSYADFFNPDDVSLSASIRDPDANAVEQPGFLARFEGDEESQPRAAVPATKSQTGMSAPRKPVWLIRYTPTKIGKYDYTVTVRNKMGKAVSALMNFSAVENKGAGGFLRVDKRDPLMLELDSGEPFYPVGQNVCWANDYAGYFRKMSEAGENFTRIWICPWNLMIEKKGKLGEYDLDQAGKLDAVLEEAGKCGIRVMLVLQYHGMLNASSWDANPYNRANGGPCAFASDYFTNNEAKKFTKRFLRYAAARWGACPSLGAWELFNEVDLTDYYDPDAVIDWHRTMAAYLKTVDAHGHPVTTSAVREGFYQKLWKVPELDINTGHIYSLTLSDAVTRMASEAAGYRKPFIVAECAGGTNPEDDQKDPRGVRLHSALWSSFLSSAAGSAMPWWWDTHIEPGDLYGQFAGLARFAKGDDRRGRHFTTVRAMVDAGNRKKLGVQGLLDHAGGYLWVYDPGWLEKPEAPVADTIPPGTCINVTGILDGSYTVEVWETTGTEPAQVKKLKADDGKLSISLSTFTRDLALKIILQGPATPSVQSTAGSTPAVHP